MRSKQDWSQEHQVHFLNAITDVLPKMLISLREMDIGKLRET